MPILIDCEKLTFVKAAKTVEQLQYWADILCPDSDYLIADTQKKVYAAFTEMELKILYGNTIMQDMRHIIPSSYNKLLNEVVKLGEGIEEDETELSDLKKKLGKALSSPFPLNKPTQISGGSPTKPKAPPSVGKRPKAGTSTAKVWDIADEMMAGDPGLGIDSKDFRKCVIEECVKEGLNPSTASTQFGKWKNSK